MMISVRMSNDIAIRTIQPVVVAGFFINRLVWSVSFSDLSSVRFAFNIFHLSSLLVDDASGSLCFRMFIKAMNSVGADYLLQREDVVA